MLGISSPLACTIISIQAAVHSLFECLRYTRIKTCDPLSAEQLLIKTHDTCSFSALVVLVIEIPMASKGFPNYAVFATESTCKSDVPVFSHVFHSAKDVKGHCTDTA